MTTPNVFVKVGTTMAKVQPHRQVLVKYQLEQASKIKSVKAFRSALMRKADKREYPRFIEGQTTEQYVEAYWELNGRAMGLATHWHPKGPSKPLEGEVQRLINGLYELPLGTNPQSTPLFDGVEEPI